MDKCSHLFDVVESGHVNTAQHKLIIYLSYLYLYIDIIYIHVYECSHLFDVVEGSHVDAAEHELIKYLSIHMTNKMYI
jgi:hypothetical protein